MGSCASTQQAPAPRLGPPSRPSGGLSTHLSIVKLSEVRGNRRVEAIAGALSSHRIPLRDKVVYLDRRTATGGWVVVGKEVTHRFGAVVFPVPAKVAR